MSAPRSSHSKHRNVVGEGASTAALDDDDDDDDDDDEVLLMLVGDGLPSAARKAAKVGRLRGTTSAS